MTAERGLAMVKALADPSRLAIVRSLLDGPQYVEELAQRHGLAASTVSFHLRKLEEAHLVSSRREQYYAVFRARSEALAITLREIVAAQPAGRELQDRRMDAYRQKVLDTFLRDGQLVKLPAQHKKRRIVLERIADLFAPDRRYGEAEVTALLRPLHDDYCTLRRLLVDERLVRREGSTYWRESDAASGPAPEAGANTPTPAPAAATTPTPVPVPAATAAPPAPAPADDRRADRVRAKRIYKATRPAMGIYQLRNAANGRVYVGAAVNLEGARNSRLFQLRMGSIVFSRELQRDLDAAGAASFTFSVLEEVTAEGSDEEARRRLALRHQHWLRELQPFGERGYNSLPAYRRDRRRLQEQGILPWQE